MELFGDRIIEEGQPGLQLYAPAQAADAALVPLDIRLSATVVPRVKALTLVIDRNPAPVAARIVFGSSYRERADIGERVIATRVRIDNFSKVRAVIETMDGQLAMVSRFVAGAGGCSSPASKDAENALAELGRVQVKRRGSQVHGSNWREGIVMIRHPNFTGMQMSGTSGTYTPARFVDHLAVTSGATELLRIEGGISISENPYFRLTYAADAVSERLAITGRDTAGVVIAGEAHPGGH